MNSNRSTVGEKRIERMKIKANILELGLYPLLYKKHNGIEKITDIRYSLRGKRTCLDLVREKNAGSRKQPLLIYIHGGGWVSGRRKARLFYCERWAENGFTCANIGYDYANDAKHPEHIRQIFSGIEYVLDNAERYGIDSEKIVVAGESAGGYFAALVGAIASHRELYDLLGISFRYRDTFRVSACVPMSGIFDPVRAIETNFPDIDLFAGAFCGMTLDELRSEKGQKMRSVLAPSAYTDEKFPPSFIIGSDKDLLRPESEMLHQELDYAGVRNELVICTGLNGVHAGSLACHLGSGKTAFEKEKKFVDEVLYKTELKIV